MTSIGPLLVIILVLILFFLFVFIFLVSSYLTHCRFGEFVQINNRRNIKTNFIGIKPFGKRKQRRNEFSNVKLSFESRNLNNC